MHKQNLMFLCPNCIANNSFLAQEQGYIRCWNCQSLLYQYPDRRIRLVRRGRVTLSPGAIGGAVAGALIGSTGGPIGTLIGGLIGGVLGQGLSQPREEGEP